MNKPPTTQSTLTTPTTQRTPIRTSPPSSKPTTTTNIRTKALATTLTHQLKPQIATPNRSSTIPNSTSLPPIPSSVPLTTTSTSSPLTSAVQLVQQPIAPPQSTISPTPVLVRTKHVLSSNKKFTTTKLFPPTTSPPIIPRKEDHNERPKEPTETTETTDEAIPLILRRLPRIQIKRDAPLGNDDEFTSLTQTANFSQSNANLNVRLQYYQQKARKSFMVLWARICELHNKNIDVVRTLINIDPSKGTRTWMRRSDIVASFVGEALLINVCKKVKIDQIYWEGKKDGKCYESLTPVLVEDETYFIRPGSKDLEKEAPTIPCEKRIKPIFKINNSWPDEVKVFSNQLLIIHR